MTISPKVKLKALVNVGLPGPPGPTGPPPTGTSGHKIPFLDTANTWSATQTFLPVSGLALDAETANAYSSPTVASSTFGKILEGSFASPMTTDAPTVGIQRVEAINVDTQGAQNPALRVESFGINTSNIAGGIIAQTTGISVVATQVGFGDVCGVVSAAIQDGAAGRFAYGGFFGAQVLTAGGNANGINVVVNNGMGADIAYTPGGTPSITGVFVQSAGANLSTVGMYVGNPGAGSIFDVGLGFGVGAIKTTAIEDDSSSITILKATGSHTDGINLSGATFSGAQARFAHLLVGPGGNIDSSVVPASAPTLSSSGSTISIANGSSAPIAALCGLIMVHEATATGAAAAYFVSSAGGISAKLAGDSQWVAATTTPAAGQMSVCFDGSVGFRIYNNRGGTSTFFVGQWQN
jgi:hypothetical protein